MTQSEQLPTEDIKEAQKKRAEAKEKYVDSLQAANAKTREELDKTLITLSTVLIGVVLTLRQQLALAFKGFGFPMSMWIAIGLLLTCILAVLASHFVSVQVNQKIIDAVEGMEATEATDPDKARRDLDSASDSIKYVKWLNVASVGGFFAGLVTVIVFAIDSADGKI